MTTGTQQLKTDKSGQWMLTIASLIIPFLIVYLNSNIYYSQSSWRYSLWCFLGVPIAALSLAVPIKLAPIVDAAAKEKYRVPFILVTTILLLVWSAICSILIHGDSL
jgi:hypothetical protein